MERKRKYVLDASIVAKWYAKEEGTDKALEVREQYFLDIIDIILPDLILYELPNALKYGAKLTQEEILDALESLLDLQIPIIMPQTSTARIALQISFDKGISYYDAYYVAVAKEIGFEFIHADKKLQVRVKDLGYVKMLNEICDSDSRGLYCPGFLAQMTGLTQNSTGTANLRGKIKKK